MMAKHWLGEGRIVWLLLILLPVTAWAVLAILASTYVSPQSATGDPLLDKYCNAVIDQALATGLDREWLIYNNYQLEDAVFASWEDEFAADPRFWMLRYHQTADESVERAGIQVKYGKYPSVHYLEEARRRGLADGAVLLRLLCSYDSAWLNATSEYVTMPKPQRGGNFAEYYKAQRDAVDEHYGQEHQELLSKLLAVAADEALPHYYAALYASERGDCEAAIAEIIRGNRAPRNTVLQGFPFDDLWHRMRTGKPLPEKAASGILCQEAIALALPNFIKFKAMTRQLIADAIEREDLGVLEELNTFACRFGDAEGNQMIGALVGLVMVQLTWEAANSSWPQPFQPDQQQALRELKQKIDGLKNEIRGISRQATWPTNLPGAISQLGMLTIYENMLNGGRGFSVMFVESLHDEALAEQQGLAGTVHQLFIEIESFDYTTLSWEEPLG